MVIKAATIEADTFRHDETLLGYIRDGAVISYEKHLADTDQFWELGRQRNVMIVEFCEYAKLPEKKLRFDVPGKIAEPASDRKVLRDSATSGFPFMYTAKRCQAGDTFKCQGNSKKFCLLGWDMKP
jgi:hypothetical protein